ncbi:hypothetical protein D9M68_638100 [compost metagenome]
MLPYPFFRSKYEVFPADLIKNEVLILFFYNFERVGWEIQRNRDKHGMYFNYKDTFLN